MGDIESNRFINKRSCWVGIIMVFFYALRVQGRVISALILRETRSRYGNNKLGFFWALVEPAAHVAVFMAIFAGLGREAPIGGSTGLFILTGIIPWLLYSNIANKVMHGFTANKALLGYPQVMPIDITISRVLIEFSSLFIVMLFFLITVAYTGTNIKIDSFIMLMNATGLFLLLGTGVGLINAAIVHSMPSYKNIYSALSRPLYFVSGIFFTADFLAPEAYSILKYNPLLHLMEWFRSGFYVGFDSALFSRSFAISVTLIIFFVGLIAERLTRKKARQG